MCACHNLSNTRRQASIFVILVITISIPTSRTIFASKEAPNIEVPTLLVLNNCDSDNNHTIPPYRDDVFLLNSKGELVRRLLLDLTIGYIWGGGRIISISEDGRYFVVCEDMADRLTVYETVTGIKVWSLTGVFKSAVFANGLVYALNNESVFAIDNTGTIIKHSRIGGFDIVVDPSGDCIWIVGQGIKKCDFDLHVIMTINHIRQGACSVDVNPDGSIWVADKIYSTSNRQKSCLLRISPHGSILKTIDLNVSPVCVRVDKSDGSIWITGTRERHRDFSILGDDWPETIDELNSLIGDETETHTLKYDSEGNLLLSIAKDGGSIDLDPSDGSIWIAGRKKIWHYSSTGTNLTTQAEVSDCQKWLAVVHKKNKGK